MKAIVMRATGGPDVLQYVDVPTPRPRPGEVLVKAHAIGVNRPEILVRQGKYRWMPKLPAIPGIEMSGTIAEIGDGVTGAHIGQPVFVSARDLPERAGCYAEYISVPTDAAHHLPDGCDLDMAACLSNYDVAYHALHTAPQGPTGTTVLITGASGGIGGALLQLAKAAGKHVIAVTRSAAGATALNETEADAVVMAGPDLTARVKALTTGTGVDLVLDVVGGQMLLDCIELLAPFGMIVSCGRIAGIPDGNLYARLYEHLEACPAIRFFSMHALDGQPQIRRAAMRELATMLGAGRIRPRIAGVFPLAEAAAAHTALESRTLAPGKIILRP